MDFHGKPLVTYALEAALAVDLFTTLVVTTDDSSIQAITKTYTDPRLVVLQRPEHLSNDQSKAIEYVHHALNKLEGETDYDIVVIVQVTSPFTTAADIKGTIELLINEGADSAVSVVRLEQAMNPYKMKVMHGNKLLPFGPAENDIMAEHELPEIFVRNGSVYASTLQTFLSGRIIGDDCRGYVMPPERSVDINTELDFRFAQFLYQNNQH